MIQEIIIFTVLLIALATLLIYIRRQEARHLKKRGLEAMSPELRHEIEEERKMNSGKKEKFDEAMKKARGE